MREIGATLASQLCPAAFLQLELATPDSNLLSGGVSKTGKIGGPLAGK